jgi:hypothetical protein
MTNSFDYRAAGLDEKVIDEILSKKLCDVVVARIPAAKLILTPGERKEFLKRYPPKIKTRKSGPFDYIIRNLTILIKNKNLTEDDRRLLTKRRDYYKSLQIKATEEQCPKGLKLFLEEVKRDQLYDLVMYITTARKRSNRHNTDYNLKQSFTLAAQIWNVKHNGCITEKQVRNFYYGA